MNRASNTLLAVGLLATGLTYMARAPASSWQGSFERHACEAGEPSTLRLTARTMGRTFLIPVEFEFRGVDRGMARFVRGRPDDPRNFDLLYFGKISDGQKKSASKNAEAKAVSFLVGHLNVSIHQSEIRSVSGVLPSFQIRAEGDGEFLLLSTSDLDRGASLIKCSLPYE